MILVCMMGVLLLFFCFILLIIWNRDFIDFLRGFVRDVFIYRDVEVWGL